MSDEGVSALSHANGWHHADSEPLSQSAVFYLLAFGVRFMSSDEADILLSTFAINFANTAL